MQPHNGCGLKVGVTLVKEPPLSDQTVLSILLLVYHRYHSVKCFGVGRRIFGRNLVTELYISHVTSTVKVNIPLECLRDKLSFEG